MLISCIQDSSGTIPFDDYIIATVYSSLFFNKGSCYHLLGILLLFNANNYAIV